MHKRTEAKPMTVFVNKNDAGKVGTYILRAGTIKLMDVRRIGGCWMVQLEGVTNQHRVDILDLLTPVQIDMPPQSILTSDEGNAWGCF